MTNPQHGSVNPASVNANAAQAANVAASQVSGPKATSKAGNYSTTTTVASLDDLKHKAPEVYDAMVKGIMINIIQSGQRSLNRWKEMMRKGREDAKG